jgi:hypothetical protein
MAKARWAIAPVNELVVEAERGEPLSPSGVMSVAST